VYYLGIDIGGTGIKIGVVTEKGTIIEKKRIPTKGLTGYEAVVEAMAKLALETIEASGLTISDIEAVGIGIPGAADDKNGVAYYCNNLYMKNAPICEAFRKFIDLPTYLGNDANCAALGEFSLWEDKGVSNFVAVTLGTGIGGGIIINKKLYTGFNGIGGEIGHINLRYGDEPCSCGRCGCWEAYASATALIRDTERAAKENPTSLVASMIENNGGRANGIIAFDAAKAGDETGKIIVDNYIKYLGEGIIDIINIFQPEIVAIGGGICNQGDNLLIPLREYVAPRTYGSGLVPATEIVIATLGNDAGIIGAAFLAR